jgi:hypothetical protein
VVGISVGVPVVGKSEGIADGSVVGVAVGF